jgi:hypothetical protein
MSLVIGFLSGVLRGVTVFLVERARFFKEAISDSFSINVWGSGRGCCYPAPFSG